MLPSDCFCADFPPSRPYSVGRAAEGRGGGGGLHEGAGAAAAAAQRPAQQPEGAAQDGGAAHHPAPPGQFRRPHITHHQADAQVLTLMPDPEQVFRPIGLAKKFLAANHQEIREC
jgi:hypothetical protein